jgi:hypothetical protein
MAATNADSLCNMLQEPDKQRHLLRLWLSPDDDRPLPDYCESAVHILCSTCPPWQPARVPTSRQVLVLNSLLMVRLTHGYLCRHRCRASGWQR